MATIMTIKVEKKTLIPKYNPHQTGTGVWVSNKYKKKGKVKEKLRKELKGWC